MADVTLEKLDDYMFTVRGSDGSVIVELDPLDVVLKMGDGPGDDLAKFVSASGLKMLSRFHQMQVFAAFDEHLGGIKKKAAWLPGAQPPTGSTPPATAPDGQGSATP